jgi:hypothetical protein
MKMQACELGLESVVSKLKDSRYVAGHSDFWIKTPGRKRETCAIVGYALKGRKFGGFYLGEERGGRLEHAGKIESGWTEKEKLALLARSKRFPPKRPRSQQRSTSRRPNGPSRAYSSMSNTGQRPKEWPVAPLFLQRGQTRPHGANEVSGRQTRDLTGRDAASEQSKNDGVLPP